jgi:hypothetical protein
MEIEHDKRHILLDFERANKSKKEKIWQKAPVISSFAQAVL